jgi:phosphoribosylformylglycinamidine (FGAM) synthase PurS component
MEAEAEQNIDWEAVDRSPSGKVNEKRFHVILHYEHVTEDESKFDAMQNTLLGNTVIENAEVSIIQVAPDLPIEPLERRDE